MTSIDVQQRIRKAWDFVVGKVRRSIVFLDSACAESLHWNGGAKLILDGGALNFKEFNAFEGGASHEKKAVFMLSSPLVGTVLTTLKDIIEASSFEYVVVVSSLSPAMHTMVQFGVADDENKAFYNLEDQLCEWMGNMNYTAEVMYAPITCAPISPHLFVLPDHSHVAPLLPSDIQAIQRMHQKEQQAGPSLGIEYTHLPRECQLQLKLLVCTLNSMMEQLSISEDCYALGPTSKILASELALLPWAKARRKNAQNKASLLLVDRTLDLVSAVGHHSETLLDKMMSTLPHLPLHTNDVQVNMAPLCSVPSNCQKNVIVPGCLGHPTDHTATLLLNTMLIAKQKESLMEVNRQLVEAASSAALPLKLSGRPGRVTAQSLNDTLHLFKGKMSAIRRHSGLVQIGQAVVQTLESPELAKQDSLLGVEKGLIQCAGEEGGPSLITQITHTINRETDKPKENRLYSLEDLCILLVYIYSLMSPDDPYEQQEESVLQSALIGAIMEEETNGLPTFLQEIVGEERDHDTVCEAVEDMFTKLRSLSLARENFKQFREVYEQGSAVSVASLKPLLKQVADALFDPNKPELPDIIYKSTGFRDLLKSGFGLFMNVSKPRPSDQPMLIIFVVGGVTSTEVRHIKEAVANSRSNVQVLVGSTSLINPKDILHSVLAQDNLRPQTIQQNLL